MPITTQPTSLLQRLPRHMVALLRVVGRLADAQDVAVYLVGGVVRDLLLRRATVDLDLVVEGDGIGLARRISTRFHTGLTIFDRFATARLQFPNGLGMDVATTRRESYAQPAELPTVKPAGISEDLYRRDFTVNAMAIRLNAGHVGELIDYYGGRKDLRNRIIRVLHDRSFEDDPTRIFRAVRFEQRFSGRLEPRTNRLLRKAAETNLIDRLSGPRLCNEWFLLFNEQDPARAMDRLRQLKLFRFLHPQLQYKKVSRKLIHALPKAIAWWTKRYPMRPLNRSILYLMALLNGASEPVVDEVIARLLLSNEEARKVRSGGGRLKVIMRRLCGIARLRPSEIYRLLIGLPDEALLLLLATAIARRDAAEMGRTEQRLSNFVSRLCGRKTTLRGDDLLRMGLRPGPKVKDLLTKLLDARMDGVVRTKGDERAFVMDRLTSAELP